MRISQKYLCIAFFFFALQGNAQKKADSLYHHEISITSENDVFLFALKDAYYTNGFFIHWATAKQRKGYKTIHTYELGQMMFTPATRKINDLSKIDRPYAGYLYVKYQQSWFLEKSGVLQWSLALGTTGPASLAHNAQDLFHKIFKTNAFSGWQYQVKNSPGIDLNFRYAETLFTPTPWFKIVPEVTANLGTTFTNASLATYVCIGKINQNNDSKLFNAGLQVSPSLQKKNWELFVYTRPEIVWQLYNATIEGGIFANKAGSILAATSQWVFQQRTGVCLAVKRWNTRLELVHQSKETHAQIRSHKYVSVRLGYFIH